MREKERERKGGWWGGGAKAVSKQALQCAMGTLTLLFLHAEALNFLQSTVASIAKKTQQHVISDQTNCRTGSSTLKIYTVWRPQYLHKQKAIYIYI